MLLAEQVMSCIATRPGMKDSRVFCCEEEAIFEIDGSKIHRYNEPIGLSPFFLVKKVIQQGKGADNGGQNNNE
ncbi:hypothetical protein ABE137_17170 [Brevibacillus laterosporus]|uniref:hypothetical protein n=1 Tax=Brevibacillus laterosporus TaxID=1465 RepID=UPI003D1BAE76